MDRNVCRSNGERRYSVALRKESVDRNQAATLNRYHFATSLSARRAWIEIRRCVLSGKCCWSLSARRAWIEIEDWLNAGCLPRVALRKESVDRNAEPRILFLNMLVALRKESVDRNRACILTILICTVSLSARRAWIEI